MPNSTIEVHAYEWKRIDPAENVSPYLHPENEKIESRKYKITKQTLRKENADRKKKIQGKITKNMKEYKSRFNSENMERIVNRQIHLLKPELVELVSRTSNGKAIDYTHTIDINFEERKHEIIRRLTTLRKKVNPNIFELKRLETTLKRLSSTAIIEYDFKAFLRRIRKRLDFDAFYIIPNENHVHILIVLYDGDIKHFIRKAKNKPLCWNVEWKPFDTTMDEYLENKVKYLMEKERNMDIRNYEEIIYDFYPDKNRIDSFFDKHRNMYEYRLHKMGKRLINRLTNTQ